MSISKKNDKSSNTTYTAIVQTPIGKLGIIARPFLTNLEFLGDNIPLHSSQEPIIGQIVHELSCYFKNPRYQFTLPYYCINGTTFQKRVWDALVRLPVGETITYGELAKQLKTGARAVGSACRTNPLPLLIPCHRVLAKYDIGGFSGDRFGKKITIKRWLLTHEHS